MKTYYKVQRAKFRDKISEYQKKAANAAFFIPTLNFAIWSLLFESTATSLTAY
jgi:hypothetical protein